MTIRDGKPLKPESQGCGYRSLVRRQLNVLRMLPFCGVLVDDLAAAAQILIRVRENFTQRLSRYARGPCVKRTIS